MKHTEPEDENCPECKKNIAIYDLERAVLDATEDWRDQVGSPDTTLQDHLCDAVDALREAKTKREA